MKKLINYLLSLLLLGACTTLSKDGKNINVVEREELPKVCKKLKAVQKSNGKDVEVEFKNIAAQLHGTHVVIEDVDDKSIGNIYKCPSSNAILAMCDKQKNGMACYDIGRLKNGSTASEDLNEDPTPQDEQAAYRYFQHSCEYGFKLGCQEAEKLHSKIEHDKEVAQRKFNCIKQKNDQDCLVQASEEYENKNIKEAIKYSQLSCVYGNDRGCKLHQDFINQHISNERNIASERDAEIQADASERAAHINAQAISDAESSRQLQQSFQNNRSKTTNCTGYGNSVNCTTY